MLKNQGGVVPASIEADSEKQFVIYPKLPRINGIFNLGSNQLIVANNTHGRIIEHLHDHFPHLHIRYGFEIPHQSFAGIDSAALEVAMMINIKQRVDCNPVFVGRGRGAEGVCAKIAGQDIHWVHNEEVGKKATKLYEDTGRKVPKDKRFIGFKTSDLEERKVRRYTRAELIAAVGLGFRADQHFQATWIEPSKENIEPYDVVICLSDDETSYHTIFNLPVTISIGAF